MNTFTFFFSGNGILKSERVIDAMKKVDRANFCKYSPYNDSPQSIGYHVTISAPHMVPLVYPFITHSDS